MSSSFKLSRHQHRRRSQMPGSFPASPGDDEFSLNRPENDKSEGVGESSRVTRSRGIQRPFPKESGSTGNSQAGQRSPRASKTPTKSKVQGHDKEIDSRREIFIALMGITGSGKSTFIQHCTSVAVEIGHGLQSCKIQLTRLTHIVVEELADTSQALRMSLCTHANTVQISKSGWLILPVSTIQNVRIPMC